MARRSGDVTLNHVSPYAAVAGRKACALVGLSLTLTFAYACASHKDDPSNQGPASAVAESGAPPDESPLFFDGGADAHFDGVFVVQGTACKVTLETPPIL